MVREPAGRIIYCVIDDDPAAVGGRVSLHLGRRDLAGPEGEGEGRRRRGAGVQLRAGDQEGASANPASLIYLSQNPLLPLPVH